LKKHIKLLTFILRNNMIVIDKILNEWSFRCHDGIVDMKDPKKKAILDEILKEYNTNLKEVQTAKEFETLIFKKYVAPNQKISGLNFLYENIVKSDNVTELFSLIEKSGGKTLQPGEYSITNKLENELYYLISNGITIPNGNPSELWFAIMYNGKVVGGVKSEETGDAAADIIADEKSISLKNYSSSGTIDLGTLPSDTSKAFNKLLNFLGVVTGTEIDSTIPVSSLNNVLNATSNEDVKDFLDFAQDNKSKWVQNLYSYIKSNDLDNIKEKFIENLNSAVLNKINKVNYWVAIIGDKIYIKSSEEISNKVSSSTDEISTAISSLKGNHLFVNGNVVFLGKEKGKKGSSQPTPIVDINKQNYKSLTSAATKEKETYISRQWVKDHPEYKKLFNDDKSHPLYKDFILLKPDVDIEFNPIGE